MSNGIINMDKNIATASFHPNYLASGKCCIAVGYKREERVWLILDDGMELLSPWKHTDPPPAPPPLPSPSHSGAAKRFGSRVTRGASCLCSSVCPVTCQAPPTKADCQSWIRWKGEGELFQCGCYERLTLRIADHGEGSGIVSILCDHGLFLLE